MRQNAPAKKRERTQLYKKADNNATYIFIDRKLSKKAVIIIKEEIQIIAYAALLSSKFCLMRFKSVSILELLIHLTLFISIVVELIA